jgi:hypothetical protein
VEDEGWIPLRDFVENNPLIADMWREIERRAVYIDTRRIVEVTTRKYKARRKRRR